MLGSAREGNFECSGVLGKEILSARECSAECSGVLGSARLSAREANFECSGGVRKFVASAFFCSSFRFLFRFEFYFISFVPVADEGRMNA